MADLDRNIITDDKFCIINLSVTIETIPWKQYHGYNTLKPTCWEMCNVEWSTYRPRCGIRGRLVAPIRGGGRYGGELRI